jgi:hypothetical protein
VTNPPVAATADDFIADIVQRERLKVKKQVDKNPGSSLHGQHVSAARLNRNPERLMAAIATVQKDIKLITVSKRVCEKFKPYNRMIKLNAMSCP